MMDPITVQASKRIFLHCYHPNTVFTRDIFDRGGPAILLLREVSCFFDVYDLNSPLVNLVDISFATTLLLWITNGSQQYMIDLQALQN